MILRNLMTYCAGRSARVYAHVRARVPQHARLKCACERAGEQVGARVGAQVGAHVSADVCMFSSGRLTGFVLHVLTSP